MRKTSVRLAISVLIVLTLVSGIALGAYTNGSNQTNATATPTTTGTATVTGVTTPTVTATATETVEETEASTPKETEQKVTPEKTIKPKPTESPGFESIFAIATILSVVYIFGTRRR